VDVRRVLYIPLRRFFLAKTGYFRFCVLTARGHWRLRLGGFRTSKISAMTFK
jgi:hypothetical protein